MQSLIVAGGISLFQELWDYLSDKYFSAFQELWNYSSEKFFSLEMPYLENFKVESNALFSLRWIIIGITVGIIIAAISTVYNKRYIGDFVRRVLYMQCYDAKSAKTLAELEYSGYPGIRSAIKTGGTLTRWVRCAEEDEFYAELEKQREEFQEAHKDEAKPPKFKEPEFRRDCSTMHFYIPEEMKYKAEVKFDKTGANWIGVILVAIVAIVIGLVLCYILPDVLKYIDNFISILKSI